MAVQASDTGDLHGYGDYLAVVLAIPGHTQSPAHRSHGQVLPASTHQALLHQELPTKLVPSCE